VAAVTPKFHCQIHGVGLCIMYQRALRRSYPGTRGNMQAHVYDLQTAQSLMLEVFVLARLACCQSPFTENSECPLMRFSLADMQPRQIYTYGRLPHPF